MSKIIQIFLADDDKDDEQLFLDALEELDWKTNVATFSNGEKLMQQLSEMKGKLPDVLFLDLNMPRKNGFDCLQEIKTSEKLKQLPVVIVTTSYDEKVVNKLYTTGANYYIRKPNNFEELKQLIHQALILTGQAAMLQPPREKFVLALANF